jgi:hypothetical protein
VEGFFMNVFIIGTTDKTKATVMGAALISIRLITVQRNDVSKGDTP